MKTWTDDNVLDMYMENGRRSYLKDLQRLASGEIAAAVQYRMAYESVTGPEDAYLRKHFKEHTKDEWRHYTLLCRALEQRGGAPSISFAASVKDAVPETHDMESFESLYLAGFFEQAESEAVEAYSAFLTRIEDQDADLADLIRSIIQDERDHRLDMEEALDGEGDEE